MLILKKADCCAKMARWALFLQDFMYTIEHRSGSYMRHANALNRNIHDDDDEWTSRKKIAAKLKKSQLDDEEIKQI